MNVAQRLDRKNGERAGTSASAQKFRDGYGVLGGGECDSFDGVTQAIPHLLPVLPVIGEALPKLAQDVDHILREFLVLLLESIPGEFFSHSTLVEKIDQRRFQGTEGIGFQDSARNKPEHRERKSLIDRLSDDCLERHGGCGLCLCHG